MNGAIVAGLGNPGGRYTATRHNVGFLFADAYAHHHGARPWRVVRDGCVTTVEQGDHRVTLLKPLTFMNESGRAVRRVLNEQRLSPSCLIVVLDDMDLPFGRLRLREGGSSGGHRGLGSIIQELGMDEFPRLRIGIGRPPTGQPTIGYVLESFSRSELTHLQELFKVAIAGVDLWIGEERTASINLVNGYRLDNGEGVPKE